MKKIISLFAITVLFPALLAAGNGEGLALVRSIYGRMQVQPKGSEVFYFNYSIRTTMRKAQNGKDRVSESAAEIFVSATQARFISRQVEVYTDEKNSFTVIPSRKTIYWGDSNRGNDHGKYAGGMALLQDSLLAKCEEKEYKVIDIGGADRLVVLEPKAGLAKKLGVSRLLFYISTKTKSIRKVAIDYPKENEMESVEMTFRKVDFNYAAPAMKGQIKALFITGRSSLAPAYAGYRLIDNRKK